MPIHDQHQQERKNVISNPYYPNTAIDRWISDIPFGMVILDSNEVGLELVNSSNTKEFFAGVWINDEEFVMAMKSFYETHECIKAVTSSLDNYSIFFVYPKYSVL
jgi:hypothetical protein